VRRLRLSTRARADIAEISAWSEANWGRSQRDSYVNELLGRMAQIPSRPQIGPRYGAHRPGLRRLRIGAHVAFYRFDDDRVVVLRVLDQRRDIETQLDQTIDDD
jgi:toxin ParE1/3/4